MTSADYLPSPSHTDLGDGFFDEVRPAEFPRAIPRFRNDRWAARIGLGDLSDADWVRHFATFEPLPDNLARPLALRYHGHQFRSYNPDLGDGRGFLFAQVRDSRDNRLLDLGTKGSGTTPWSRQGDGRLTLKGGVREILATEMLEALGVYTSKTFSLIETGEQLFRHDEPSPTRAGVLTRLGHSHIRIGSFQRCAALGQFDDMRRLVDYSIARYWPEAADHPAPVARFYELVLDAVARLGAEWFTAGFVHGVLNTDNINITGESFDYGPWRFLDRFDPGFTAAYFDHSGLYAFGRQPEALNWNLARLGECLILISSREAIEPVFETFPDRFKAALARRTLARLGLVSDDPALALDLTVRFWEAMQRTAPPFQRVFFDLVGVQPERLKDSPISSVYATEGWREIIRDLSELPPVPGLAAALGDDYAGRAEPETMTIEEVEAIWLPIDRDDDWSGLTDRVRRVREMGRFNARLGLMTGQNGRDGHLPIL